MHWEGLILCASMMNRGRPAHRIELTAEERSELMRRVRAPTSEQREVERARIILASEEGETAQHVAIGLGVHSRRVERWRSRFAKSRLAGLKDRARSGRKAKFNPAQRCEIIAIACDPIETDKGKTTRTIEDVVRQAIQRGVVEGIGWTSVQRILADGEVRPHKVDGWLHSTDPLFREKVKDVVDLYLSPPVGSVVLSIDEKPGMQALERRYPDRLPKPGKPRRREYEYRRHGTQTLLCAFEVHKGRVIAECGDTRKASDLVRFMEQIALEYPTGPVHIVWDNLNIHFDGKDKRWTQFNERHGGRFVFHYTPKHASWVNQVECFFSILERQSLRQASFSSKEQLRDQVLTFIAHWNREKARPFNWTFTGYPLRTGHELGRAA